MEDSQLIKITQSNIKRALDGNVVITNFLNTHEQEIVKPLLDNSINWYFDGGYEAAEYKRLVLSPLAIKPSSKVSILKVNYNKRFACFTNRHILGNLMAMGVKRETIGDIVISDDCLLYKCVVSNDSKTLELIKSEDSNKGIAIKGKDGPKGYSLDKTITNIVFSEKQITDGDGSKKTIYGMSYTGTYNTIV